ncbi:PREDICTED: LOW QUALITY PROTEIN: heat shock factor protein 5, partial [Nestor notabilis]|uniref:LOW QUALITY PROTEIN: heat shock factor protein 5 n=1 Tax=Nestor notabilis TaxID=176057 RepID=UPI0005238D71
MTVGQVHQPGGPDTFFPYLGRAASCQNPAAFLTKAFQQTPVPSRPWQGSLGLLPGQGPSTAVPSQGSPFPILHRCSTEVTYTLQTVFSLLPLHASAASPASTDCGFVQSSPVQPPSAAEWLPSGGASDEDKMMEELSLEAMLQILDKMLLPPSAEEVTLEPVESEMSTPQSIGTADTSFLMEAAQALTSAEGCDGKLLFVPYDTASVERVAAAEMAPEPVATQEAPEEWREQLGHCPAQPPEMFVLEGLFSAEQ